MDAIFLNKAMKMPGRYLDPLATVRRDDQVTVVALIVAQALIGRKMQAKAVQFHLQEPSGSQRFTDFFKDIITNARSVGQAFQCRP